MPGQLGRYVARASTFVQITPTIIIIIIILILVQNPYLETVTYPLFFCVYVTEFLVFQGSHVVGARS